jgi:sugar-specific transcriptional regulator TrmB
MGELDKNVDRLCQLGLTSVEAKTFLILAKAGITKIQNIARMAEMDRANTYQVIKQLQEMGLVEKIVGTPNLYNTVPKEEAISLLVKRKKSEYDRIMEASEILLKEKLDQETLTGDSEIKVSLVHFNEVPNKKIILAWESVQRIAELYLEKTMMVDYVPPLWENALNRGVKIQLVTEKSLECSPFMNKGISSLKRNVNFEIRYTSEPVVCSFICLDEKETWFIKNGSNRIGGFGGEALLSRYEGLGKLAHAFFKKIWSETQSKSKVHCIK